MQSILFLEVLIEIYFFSWLFFILFSHFAQLLWFEGSSFGFGVLGSWIGLLGSGFGARGVESCGFFGVGALHIKIED